MSKAVLKYERTKKGFLNRVLVGQRSTSKRRGHRPPEYTLDSLREWSFSQTKFHELFDEWEKSGYESYLRPSLDRKDNNIHYCFSNVQWMTWEQNLKKEHKFHLDYRGKSQEVGVAKYTKEGKFLESFNSVADATVSCGKKRTNRSISNCLSGRQGSAFGFNWSYIKEI